MIERPVPPPSVTVAFRNGLPAFLYGPAFGRAGALLHQGNIGGVPAVPGESDLGGPGPWDHDPQRVFSLGLEDIRNGLGITAARPVAWRYFVGETTANTALGHCSPEAGTGIWQLTTLWYGARAWQTLEATNALDSNSLIPPGNTYQLRVLTVPGLLAEAFWLVSQSGGEDLAVVFPAPPGQLLKELKQPVYDMPVFLNILLGLAITRLSFPNEKGT